MHTKHYLIILILFCSLAFGQDLTLVYKLKYKSNSLKEALTEENYFLDIKNNKSIFRSEKNRKSDSLKAQTGFGLGFGSNYNNQFDVIKDYRQNKVSKIIISPLYSDVYFLKIDNLNWIVKNEKLKIGDYECQKAVVNYGGREWTAWFSTAIPISDGPYVFNQLPGMILRIFDDLKDFTFDLVRVEKNVWKELYEAKKTKEIDWETFNSLQVIYYEQPFAQVRTQNIKMARSDVHGKPIDISSQDMRLMEENIRKNIRNTYNPIELNHKVEYSY